MILFFRMPINQVPSLDRPANLLRVEMVRVATNLEATVLAELHELSLIEKPLQKQVRTEPLV